MDIYLITIFLFFIFAIFEQCSNDNRLKKVLLALTYFISVFVVGLRWETGTDWIPYIATFESASSLKRAIAENIGMEKGYLISNWIVRLFTSNYTIYLLLHASIFYYCIIYGLVKYTKYPQVAFMCIFSESLGVVGSNRQLLAVAIIFFCLSWAYHRKTKFFSIILVAFQFHATALIASIFYFFNRRVAVKWILSIILISAIVGLTPIPKMLFGNISNFGASASDKVAAYIGGKASAQLSILGVVRRITLFCLFLYFRSKRERVAEFYNFFLNSFSFSLLIYLLFSSSLLILVNRGSLYFNISQGILLSYLLYTIKRPDTRVMFTLLLFLLSVALMYQSISSYPDEFDPYKGIWYNRDFHRIINIG